MPKVLVITGPTASGKSALALQLAEQIPGEIISMDSVQVYRGLDIGSAKPSLTERERVPHHLIDICAPDEQYDAGRFVRDVDRLIAQIHAAGKLPIVVGGTTMYLTALVHGLSNKPRSEKKLREELEALDTETLYKKLETLDPVTHAKLYPTDKVRIVRAVECVLLAGKELEERGIGTPRYDFRIIVPVVDRETLYARINARVTAMLERGLLAEVRGIAAQYGADAPGLRAIGYSQVITAPPGDEQVVGDAIRQATRRYAKRQLTYLRNEPAKKGWKTSAESEGVLTWDFARLLSELSAWKDADVHQEVELWPISTTHLVNAG